MQTNSLRFQGADGQLHVFRSVDKYPERGYPKAFRGTIIETLGKDQVSLMLPFGSLVVDILADKLGVLHPKPLYFVIPNDKRLGEHLEGLINEGNLGLVNAAHCFDETRGFKFI